MEICGYPQISVDQFRSCYIHNSTASDFFSLKSLFSMSWVYHPSLRYPRSFIGSIAKRMVESATYKDRIEMALPLRRCNSLITGEGRGMVSFNQHQLSNICKQESVLLKCISKSISSRLTPIRSMHSAPQ